MLPGRSSLVVHDFTAIGPQNTSRDAEIIRKGRDLVSVVESRDRWRPARLPSDQFTASGRALVFKKDPPSRPSLQSDIELSLTNGSIWEWGNLSGPRDIDDLSELRNFEGSDFSYLRNVRKQQKALHRLEHQTGKGKAKRTSEAISSEDHDDHDEHRQKKRRMVGNATTTLYDLIPHPHHHPYSPVNINQRAYLDITKRFPPFLNAPFLPIPPFSREESEQYFKDPYARGAWIIPIKGNLPWKETSVACLEDEATTPTPKDNKYERQSTCLHISWTPFTITKFWSDLLVIRSKQMLGAVSLSFHVATPDRTQVQITKTTKYRRAEARRNIAKTPTEPRTPDSLDQCTYVKIYHDAQYSMYVRSVLDAWRTEVEISGARVTPALTVEAGRSRPVSHCVPETKRIEVRPLQGAKLVLLDEAGRAVGFC